MTKDEQRNRIMELPTTETMTPAELAHGVEHNWVSLCFSFGQQIDRLTAQNKALRSELRVRTWQARTCAKRARALGLHIIPGGRG